MDDAKWEQAVSVDGKAWGPMFPRSLPMPRESELPGLRLVRSDQDRPELTSVLPLELTAGKEIIVDLRRMSLAYGVLDLEADEASELRIRYALLGDQGKLSEFYGEGTRYTARLDGSSL